MRIAIVADSFPPLKNSAAVLVSSLAETLAALGHELLVITPSPDIDKPYIEDHHENFRVLRIRCGKIKSHLKFLRGISELSLFFTFPREFKKTPYVLHQWDAVIWYSPSIFLSGLVGYIKKRSKCSYLILRDIVPDWMVDIGIMKKGPSYFLLKWFERYQYRLADIIGIQSPGNKRYIEDLNLQKLKELEVLPNWMPSISTENLLLRPDYSHTDLQHTALVGKKVLIYAGNLGEAQGVDNFAELIFKMKDDFSIGFLVIGRGSKKEWLKDFVKINQIQNVLILDEVDLTTLNIYYRQSHVGLVFLNTGHQSHNIPGKFVSYLEAGLPVAAWVNANNDLVNIIKSNELGLVADNLAKFSYELDSFLSGDNVDEKYHTRTRDFYETHYRPDVIATQIMAAISRLTS